MSRPLAEMSVAIGLDLAAEDRGTLRLPAEIWFNPVGRVVTKVWIQGEAGAWEPLPKAATELLLPQLEEVVADRIHEAMPAEIASVSNWMRARMALPRRTAFDLGIDAARASRMVA